MNSTRVELRLASLTATPLQAVGDDADESISLVVLAAVVVRPGDGPLPRPPIVTVSGGSLGTAKGR